MATSNYNEWSIPKVDQFGDPTHDRLTGLGFVLNPDLEPDRHWIVSSSPDIVLEWNDEGGYFEVHKGEHEVCQIWPRHVYFLQDVEDPEQ